MKYYSWLIAIFILVFYQANASHIVGGQLYYDCLGNNNYRITLEQYRNCGECESGPQCTEYSDSVVIFLFDTAGNFLNSISMPVAPRDTLITRDSICSAAFDYCVEATVYQKTVTLPYITGGYTVAYQRCCRNAIILNINQNTGSTYFNKIGETAIGTGCNSRPRFKRIAPHINFIDTAFSISLSATDPDGDSISYSLVEANDGASPTCPEPGFDNTTIGCSNIASPPPYAAVPYILPYSAANPTNNPSNSGNLRIDAITGELSGTVNQSGVFLVAVSAEEHRQGQYIGRTLFDFQFIFSRCYGQSNGITLADPKPATKIYNYGDEIVVEFDEASSKALVSCYDLLGRKIAEDITETSSIYTRKINGIMPQNLIIKVEQAGRDTLYKNVLLR